MEFGAEVKWEYQRVTGLSLVDEIVNSQSKTSIPSEIKESLERFKIDYPDADKVAFLMMRFSQTLAHAAIAKGAVDALVDAGITVLRADSKDYHDDLYYNVLTYLFGCGFGIAVFERLEGDEFNPNVSLEVGYMFALRKPVCLLKDRTLKMLQTDLVGKLYKEFDTQKPRESVKRAVSDWAQGRGIIPNP